MSEEGRWCPSCIVQGDTTRQCASSPRRPSGESTLLAARSCLLARAHARGSFLSSRFLILGSSLPGASTRAILPLASDLWSLGGRRVLGVLICLALASPVRLRIVWLGEGTPRRRASGRHPSVPLFGRTCVVPHDLSRFFVANGVGIDQATLAVLGAFRVAFLSAPREIFFYFKHQNATGTYNRRAHCTQKHLVWSLCCIQVHFRNEWIGVISRE